jgi:hypothetical protein
MVKTFFGARGVLVVTMIIFSGARATAQEQDLFGEPAPGGPEGGFVPAPDAGSAPANEKSVLAAELSDATQQADLDAHTHAQTHDFCRCVGESDAAAAARIEKVLNSPLQSNGLDFADTPLEEVVNLLQSEYGIPIQVDRPALEAVGLDPAAAVNVNLHKISLGSALRLMLKRLQLTYVIADEVLMITSPEEAEAGLSTCVYDVRGFVNDTSSKSMDELMDTIVSCVRTDSWAENGGGEAEIRSLKPGLLVISQTQAVHEEIRSLLKAIRAMRENGGDANGAALPGAGAEEVVTRVYVLKVKGDAEQLGERIREMIIQAIPDQQWGGSLPDGQSVVLTVLNDRIIVRHTPTVQDEVASLLKESGVAAPATTSEVRRGRDHGDGDRSPATDGLSAGGGGGGGIFALPDYQPRLD